MAALTVAAQSPSELRSSNVVVFSGTCAHTNFGRTGSSVGSFRGRFRFATDSKKWSLEYQDEYPGSAARQSITYDGHALYMLYENLPKARQPGTVSDIAEVVVGDMPPSFAPVRMPWLAAWSFGLVSALTNNVLPPWANWPQASLYTNRLVPDTRLDCPSKKTEFVVRASAWQALRADPRKRLTLDSDDDIKSDFVDGELVVSACTNVSGFLVPTQAKVRRDYPPGLGGGLRLVIVMNTTNVERIAGAIGKPRFGRRTQVNDGRSMNSMDEGLWVPMTRALTYYASNWLETSSPEWQMLVMSNALLEANTPDGVVGVRLGADSSGFVRIEEVFPNSPAQRAGLRAGDVVLSIDGKETKLQGGMVCSQLGVRGSTAELVFVRNARTNVVRMRRVSVAEFLR